MDERTHLSIGEVLSLLRDEFPDITISKIRFLESQGLLDPERTPSGYRKFYENDVERLRWILRQQRENFLPLKIIRGRLTEQGDELDETGPDDESFEGPAGLPRFLDGCKALLVALSPAKARMIWLSPLRQEKMPPPRLSTTTSTHDPPALPRPSMRPDTSWSIVRSPTRPSAFDPAAMENTRAVFPNLTYARDAYDCAADRVRYFAFTS